MLGAEIILTKYEFPKQHGLFQVYAAVKLSFAAAAHASAAAAARFASAAVYADVAGPACVITLAFSVASITISVSAAGVAITAADRFACRTRYKLEVLIQRPESFRSTDPAYDIAVF